MRRLAVLTCIFLVAFPVATEFEGSFSELERVSIVNKNLRFIAAELTSAETASAIAYVETTKQVAVLADDAVTAEARTEHAQPLKIEMPVVRYRASRQEVCATLASAAHANGLPVPFFIRLILQESAFNPHAVSSVGAQGVAQFMPTTATAMGLDDPFDPLQALPVSARLLRELHQQFGNLGLAAAAYNAGSKRILDWLERRGKLPQETRSYVQKITGRAPEHWIAPKATSTDLRLPRSAPCQREVGLFAWNGPAIIPRPRPSFVAKAPSFAIKITGREKPRVFTVAANSRAPLQLSAHKTQAARSKINTPVKRIRIAMATRGRGK